MHAKVEICQMLLFFKTAHENFWNNRNSSEIMKEKNLAKTNMSMSGDSLKLLKLRAKFRKNRVAPRTPSYWEGRSP